MVPGDWWDIPNSPYSIYQSSIINCPENEVPACTATWAPDGSYTVYKNNRSINLGSGTFCHGYQLFDNGLVCVQTLGLNGSQCYMWYAINWLECVASNDVYISTSGSDSNCGDTSSTPVRTFAKALSIVNSGGNIHIVSGSGSDFSDQSATFNKNVSIDLNGGTGYFYLAKAT